MAVKIAAIRETVPGERRVALVPEAVARLTAIGAETLIESGAGAAAWYSDEAYAAAGATVLDRESIYQQADIIVTLNRPDKDAQTLLRPGQVLIGLLRPLTDPALSADLAGAGVTVISLDGLPRTVSRAQSMDILSSQASVAGYRAALLAASVYDRYFPLLVTAAGTARPAEVLVLGAGVAGLQAIATARRLGAVVKAYDVRPDSAGEVRSLGASFLTLGAVQGGAGEGGYARALTPEEQQAQQDELAAHIAKQNVIITTAQVPGRRPPLLVTEAAIAGMSAGSVIVDIAASPLGGNVALSVPDETLVTPGGVTIIGAPNLPSDAASAASAAASRNICAVLAHLIADGVIGIDVTDDIQAGIVIAHDGKVVHPATAALLTKALPTKEAGGATA